jgi:hypothetical protein
MNRTFAALLFLSTTALPALAEDLEQLYAQQGHLSFELLRDNIPVNGGVVVVNPLGGFFSNGPSNFYPRTRCEAGGRTLDSVQIFSGMTMHHKVEGKEVALTLAQYAVSSPETEIRALKENECRNLSPRQQTVFQRTIKVAYTRSEKTKVVPLEGGYAFRYQAFPPPSNITFEGTLRLAAARPSTSR